MALVKRGSLRSISIISMSIHSRDVRDLVSTREADTSWAGTAASCDLNLEAADVRLGLTSSGVQRDSLGADQVVTRGDALGNGESPLSAVCVKNLGAPSSGRASVSVFGNFEERTGGCSLCVSDLGHVNHDWPVVGAADSRLRARTLIGLRVHLYSQGRAS
jgi:hypothetical protein